MISGNTKTNTSSKGEFKRKKVGMFTGIPVAVNPTKEELEKLLNTELERDYEYISKDQDGNNKLTLSIWLKTEDDELFNVRFYLIEKERESKSNPGNFQYINELGATSWASNPSDLKEWFAKRNSRKAFVGEEELHDFLRCWLNLDYSSPETTILLNTEKMFSGNVKELKDAIKNFSDTSVCCLATVRVVKEEDKETEYQTVYNKKFLPGSYIKFFKGAAGRTKPKMVEAFIQKVTDNNYGCNDFYKLSTIVEYEPTENKLTGNSAVIDTDDVY